MRWPCVSRWILVCAFAIPGSASAAAAAADWSHAFPPDSTLQLRDFFKSVAVVPAGSGASGAADALVASLKSLECKAIEVPKNLQSDSERNDKAILAAMHKAGIKPARVAIVRVYPGAKGRPLSAVALVYDKQRNLVSSLVGEEGKPAAGQPVAMGREQYSRQVLWYGTPLKPEPGTVAVDDNMNFVFQGTGRSRRGLGWSEFYRLVEKPKLASQYRHRLVLSFGAMVAGAALTSAVVLGEEDLSKTWPLAVVGVGAMAAGGIGYKYVNPASRGEIRQMIDDHNERLRVRLGVACRGDEVESEVSLAVRF